jgi:hypothetical protein
MGQLKTLAAGLVLTLATAVAANLAVQNAHLYTPNGTIDGKLVMLDNRMAFIDEANPDQSFVIPKSDISSASWDNGLLRIELSRPYSSLAGTSSEVAFSIPDTTSAGAFVNWIGVPVRGFTGEADRAVTRPLPLTDVSFEVQKGGDHGKLVVRPNEIAFVSLSDADHSARWQYSQIKEFKRDNDTELKIEPYHGDNYEFKFRTKAMRETAYDMISDQIVNARLRK